MPWVGEESEHEPCLCGENAHIDGPTNEDAEKMYGGHFDASECMSVDQAGKEWGFCVAEASYLANRTGLL